jgi:adenylate cyclase
VDIVDTDVDPLAERTRWRRTLLHIGLPLGGVGLIIGFLLGIALYADRANRAGVLGLSDSLLHNLKDRIALEVSAYLQPAAHATLLAHSMLGRGAATDRAEDAQIFAASVLKQTPQITSVLFADASGNFMMIRRAAGEPAGATETKRILLSPGSRTVEWITRDAARRVTARSEDPSDTYDARARSWFIGARAVEEVFWSNVYVFFSERTPGITAAVHGPDENPDVIAVDIKLDEVSHFLAGLAIGRTGRAYIVGKNGEMIAGPDPARILRTQDDQLVPARIHEIGDPEATGSWDHFRAHGPGDRVIELGGRRLISIVAPLERNSQGWHLVITVPEDEYSGFVTANSRHALLLSLSVVALAVGLATLLVRQGLRADRAARTVAERSEAVRQQSAAFARLATEAGMFDATGKPPPALTETLAEATGARRAGFWHLVGGGHVLRCEDSFEPATGGHVAGLELSRQEVTTLIEELTRGEEINVADARRDRRAAGLHASVMAPFGSTALLAVPVMREGRAIAVLLLEDSRRDPSALDFTRTCATLIALQTPAADAGESTTRATVAKPATPPVHEPADDQGLDASLTMYDEGGAGLQAQPRPQAVVMVLRLPETTIARAASADTADTLAHRIACSVQEIAATHAIPYVKMLGTSIVAAAGYGPQFDSGAATRLADAAIALRERCATLFESTDDPAAFGIGMDAGPVVCGTLGTGPRLFNLWGEAVQGAHALAVSAPNGGIQASEPAYRLLRQGFLFRPRGLFYRTGTGETRSFVLAGRA